MSRTLDDWFAPEKKKEIFTGKPIPPGNLRSLRPEWETDIFGKGEHFKKTSFSVKVQVSVSDRYFIECLEEAVGIDGVEWWNRYYTKLRIEIGPITFRKWVDELITRGLVEKIECI